MTEFLNALSNTPLLQSAMLGGVLAAIACGLVGPFVVARRITYLAAGITHCVLGGIGAAAYCRGALGWSLQIAGYELISPMTGALVAALLAAAIIGWISLNMKQREDTVISALWSIGMASGVIFLSLTPGYQSDPMSFLFGDILMISPANIKLMALLDIALLAVVVWRYRQFLAVCFDEEFARTRGVNTHLYYMALLCMTALTVVILVSVVGVIMVIALLTLPAATSSMFAKRLWQCALISTLLSILLTSGGLAVSYMQNLPSGATIITLAAAAYFAAVAWRKLSEKLFSPNSRNSG